MYKRILVPLDGSKRAEQAIPVAARIARASRGSLIFVRVVLPPIGFGAYGAEAVIAVEPSALEMHLADAANYLQGVTSLYAPELKGIKTETDVETGSASSTIFSTACMERVDLIVLCSHGDTGLKRWILNSVAQQAVHHSPVPVLVLNEQGESLPFMDVTRPLRVLVPLDGSALAETALEPAARLVTALAAPEQPVSLHLLGVVDVPSIYGRISGQTYIDAEIREQTRKEAETYLASMFKRFQQEPLARFPVAVTASVAVSTDVAGMIIRQAEHPTDGERCDMIAMATHGRGGLLRLLMGSVIEHVVGYTKLPLLIVRPQEPETQKEPATTEMPLASWVGLL